MIRRSNFMSWFGIVIFGLATIYYGVTLFGVVRAGIAPTVTEVGRLVLLSSFVPLFIASIYRGRTVPVWTRAPNPQEDRVFSEASGERVLFLCSFWSLAVGAFIHDLATAGSFLGPMFLGLMVLLGVFNVTRQPKRLVLSPIGIGIDEMAAGLIAWPDVREVKLARRLWRQYVELDIANSGKYGLKSPRLTLSPMLFRARAEDILEEIRLRHAMFGQTSPKNNLAQ
ncbi:hypothetical protein [Dongia sp.]|uniref:hypothetical protein n=1 Tax=Dongia sp. TaxID=1977262 RepID=UPI0035B34297